MSRNRRDRDDRRISRKAWAFIVVIAGAMLWYGYNIVVEGRIPLRRSRDITLADQPELFGWLVAAMVVLPVLAITATAIWIARGRGGQNAVIDRHLS